ncbi:UBP1-associated protein 2B-like [Panicum virgatum]|uniref:UBP1-associated protein 2B-like n=1 Tax=Panicum virgatum TaxID=38727 RepID=UPI0019D68D96|nr:UBP1-associated protein 2B-like [Panicum virgatum]
MRRRTKKISVSCWSRSPGTSSGTSSLTPTSATPPCSPASRPERAAHDALRVFFSKFGEIEEGSLGADRDTGLFRGYAIFFFKTPDGLKKALEEPTKVFDGCELQCRRAYRVTNRKHAAAAPVDTGVQSNGGAVAAVLPSVQAKDLALTSKQSVLSSNQPVGLTAEGSSSAPATVGFRQNVPAGGAGILGAAPVASSLIHGTSSTPPNHCGAAIGHVGLGNTARAGTSTIEPIIGAKNSLGASHPGRLSARPGLIQHYLGR